MESQNDLDWNGVKQPQFQSPCYGQGSYPRPGCPRSCPTLTFNNPKDGASITYLGKNGLITSIDNGILEIWQIEL